MPPERIEADWRNAAVRLCGRNAGLREKPILADPKPYLIGSTGTAMGVDHARQVPASGRQGARQVDGDHPHPRLLDRPLRDYSGEWAALVPANPSRTTGSPYLPVDGVSYEDAVKCMLLNQQESKARRIPSGYAYRLPTEAEWNTPAGPACRRNLGSSRTGSGMQVPAGGGRT